jgi:oligopeptide transport system substrate-binding protein
MRSMHTPAPATRGRIPAAAALGAALAGLAALAALVGRDTALDRADFVFANGGEVSTLDPHAARGVPEGRVLRCLYEGLVTRAPGTLAPAPGVAESWELSEDGREYVFHLRADARWSNGDPLTAEDFRWSLLRVLDPETAAPFAYELYAIAGALDFATGRDGTGRERLRDAETVGISAPDARTLVLRLERPVAYFLDLLALPTFFPVHRHSVEALQAADPALWQTRWSRPDTLVSNGPFVLALRRPGDRMRFARNAHYWGADEVAFDTVDALALSHWGTALNLYLSGAVDWIDGMLPAAVVPQLRGREDFLRTPYLGTYFLRVNTTRPPLDDARVRRALALTIPRAAICDAVLQAGQAPLTTIVPWGGIGDYVSPRSFAEDVKAARALLREAGYGPEGEEFPPIALHYNTSESHRDIAEVVAAAWAKELQIEVALENQEWKVYLDTQAQLEYDVSRSSWIADYPDPIGFLKIFTTANENNRTGWSNAAFDALITAAEGAPPGTQRNALMAEAEDLLLEELPVLPVYSYVTQNLVNARLGGFHSNVLNEHSPRDLYWMDDAELAAQRARTPGRDTPAHGPAQGKYSAAAAARRAARAEEKGG